MTIKEFLRAAIESGTIVINGLAFDCRRTTYDRWSKLPLDIHMVSIRPDYMDGDVLMDWGLNECHEDAYRLEVV